MRYYELRESPSSDFPGALHYTDWSGFKAKLDQVVSESPESERAFIEAMGFDPVLFHNTIERAVTNWRDSTSSSILQALAHLDTRIPKAGEPIFPDLKWQTRFLMKAPGDFGIRTYRVPNPDKTSKDVFIRVASDAYGMSSRTDEEINTLLQYLYLYVFLNRNAKYIGKLRLPKMIYRGIRVADLFGHPSVKDKIAAVPKELTWYERRKRFVDIVVNQIIEHGIISLADSPLLSFSSSLPVAKWFTRGDGFVLCLDPKTVNIVSSELHDPNRVAGATYETRGKDEKEYIVRIPDDLQITMSNILIWDEDYYIALNSPLSVELFSHNDKDAVYFIDGKKVKACWQWNSAGNGGKIVFTHGDDWWPYGRGEFKKTFGFDPLPTMKNLDQIKNFEIIPRKR